MFHPNKEERTVPLFPMDTLHLICFAGAGDAEILSLLARIHIQLLVKKTGSLDPAFENVPNPGPT